MKIDEGFFGTTARINIFRAFAVLAVAVLFTTQDSLLLGTLSGEVATLLGFVLVSLGIAGRAICAVYIDGRKRSTIVMTGPYSLTRNPLYLFSFIGGMGVALGGQNLLVALILFIAFLLYYPGVMKREERAMGETHGEAFEAYRRSVPLFFPRFSGYQEADEQAVKPHKINKSIREVFFFAVAFALFNLIARLHQFGVIEPFVVLW